LITAEKLEEKEENCLVIEDSPSGVEAAHRAGMKVVAILSEEEDQKDLSGADCVVESFAEITPKMIEEL
jgi:beta-phosphoglucomutase-like phosphatase (HAD superfamily)